VVLFYIEVAKLFERPSYKYVTVVQLNIMSIVVNTKRSSFTDLMASHRLNCNIYSKETKQ